MRLLQSADDIVLRIEPPHNRFYQTAFESLSWTIFMRILAPVLALWGAALATNDIRITFSEWGKSSSSSPDYRVLPESIGISLIICCVEVPSLVLIAAMMALGQYGPTMLPWSYHIAFITLASGTSLMTSTILALFLQSQIHHVSTREPCRSIWSKHGRFIATGVVLFGGFDLLTFVLIQTGSAEVMSVASVIGTILFCSLIAPAQIAVAVYFILQAWRFAKPLAFYLKHGPRSPSRLAENNNVWKIGRLVFWLMLSGLFMLLAVPLFCFLIILVFFGAFHHSESLLLSIIIGYVLARIGVSYAQVRAIIRFTDSRTFRCYGLFSSSPVSAEPQVQTPHKQLRFSVMKDISNWDLGPEL